MSGEKYFLLVREFWKIPDNFGKITHVRKKNQPCFACHSLQVSTFFLPHFAQHTFNLDIKCDYDRMQPGNTNFYSCSHILSSFFVVRKAWHCWRNIRSACKDFFQNYYPWLNLYCLFCIFKWHLQIWHVKKLSVSQRYKNELLTFEKLFILLLLQWP